MYKMVHNLVAINVGIYTTPVLRPTRKTHPNCFIHIHTSSEAYRMAYFPRTMVEWNLLPVGVVAAPTMDAFKGGLRELRQLQN